MTISCAQSFICTILESQYASELTNSDGSSTSFGAALDRANLFFTVIFTAELIVVAFSSWFLAFVSDPWCWLDMFVVGMSLVSLVLTNEPTGIARVMRALRVLRLFGRLKSLRKILSALALAIVPVCQVFLILFILLCVGAAMEQRSVRAMSVSSSSQDPNSTLTSVVRDGAYQYAQFTGMRWHCLAGSVVGVVLFSTVAPDNFAVFDRAFLTLFYVTGGDPWPDALPKFNEDGSANWIVAAYIMGYTMIEIWVILQVGHVKRMISRCLAEGSIAFYGWARRSFYGWSNRRRVNCTLLCNHEFIPAAQRHSCWLACLGITESRPAWCAHVYSGNRDVDMRVCDRLTPHLTLAIG